MARSNHNHNQRSGGFTIIELMLALTVLSVVLVSAAAGLIQVGRMYYKSVITVRTQDTSRNIINEVSQNVQFSNGLPTIVREDPNDPTSQVQVVCFGAKRYTTAPTPPFGLYRDTGPNECTAATTLGVDGVELVGQNMRLTKLQITPLDAKGIQYRVTVWVAYGDNDVLEPDPSNPERLVCKGSEVGSEFCAISELSTVVSRRLL